MRLDWNILQAVLGLIGDEVGTQAVKVLRPYVLESANDPTSTTKVKTQLTAQLFRQTTAESVVKRFTIEHHVPLFSSRVVTDEGIVELAGEARTLILTGC